MKQVWKFTIMPLQDVQAIRVPEGADVIGLAETLEGLSVYVLADPARSPVDARFWCVGTGWDVPDAARYVDTAVAGRYVWHLFVEAGE